MQEIVDALHKGLQLSCVHGSSLSGTGYAPHELRALLAWKIGPEKFQCSIMFIQYFGPYPYSINENAFTLGIHTLARFRGQAGQAFELYFSH